MILQHLAWGARVSEEFRQRVLQMAIDFAWSPEHPSYQMTCMAFESARTFSPSIMNAAGSGAVGLIQFMERTAIGLGTTKAELIRMTATEQLGWVEKYFKPYAARIKTLGDMYMAILCPKYIGHSDDEVMFSDPTIGYRENSLLDYDTDGRITKGEVVQRISNLHNIGMQPGNIWLPQSIST